MSPLKTRELNGKRKRERVADKDGEDHPVTKKGGEENMCPNGSVEKTTPVRKARGQTKGGQKLFTSEVTKMEGAGETDGVVYCPNVKSASD